MLLNATFNVPIILRILLVKRCQKDIFTWRNIRLFYYYYYVFALKLEINFEMN